MSGSLQRRLLREELNELAQFRARREAAPPRPTDHDSDLAGMIAGPQAPPDWQQEFLDEEQKAKEAAELNSDKK